MSVVERKALAQQLQAQHDIRAVRLSVSAELLTTMSLNLTMTMLSLINLPSSLTSIPAGDFQSAISGYVNLGMSGTISAYIGSIQR